MSWYNMECSKAMELITKLLLNVKKMGDQQDRPLKGGT